MRFIDNLRIGTRLGAAFATVLLLLVAMAGTAYLQLGSVFEHLTVISQNTVPTLEVIGEIDSAATRARRYTMAHVLATTSDAKVKAEDTLHGEIRKVTVNLERYRKELVSDETERRLLDTFTANWETYVKDWDQLKPLSDGALKDPRSEEHTSELQSLRHLV